ncbi:37S ribosomal protein S24, mitochondrial [Grifola frondosa]|uniref:37S ribosomal protein S24, mitochondrial n=1 Tax=Grifola frondosa TaxID=5627 RepID=A0A1C7MPJ5_GRIFR|nr:37S ribosomal protein S24, mitochondrial [Grifola frondosa]
MALTGSCRAALTPVLRVGRFHTCAITRARAERSNPAVIKDRRAQIANPLDLDGEDLRGPQQEDITAAGHLVFQQQRQLLYYLRLIEHEMPKFVAYRKPFSPPGPSMPLVIRSISYGGEAHPAAAKRTIVVPVARLPLKDAAAIHKFKLLAGPRWSLDAPRDAGVMQDDAEREHGYFKISCEEFPKAAMNLKWASDTLDRLLAEANNADDSFADVPLDTRHLEAKVRKAKRGNHVYGRGRAQPSIRDFPKEWLPVSKLESASAIAST